MLLWSLLGNSSLFLDGNELAVRPKYLLLVEVVSWLGHLLLQHVVELTVRPDLNLLWSFWLVLLLLLVKALELLAAQFEFIAGCEGYRGCLAC